MSAAIIKVGNAVVAVAASGNVNVPHSKVHKHTIFATQTGTSTYDIEYSIDDVVWFPLTGATGLTITHATSTDFPVTAFRINMTAFTSGNVSLTVLCA